MYNQETLIRFLHQGLSHEYKLTDCTRSEAFEGPRWDSVNLWSFSTPCKTVTVTLTEHFKLTISVEIAFCAIRESTFCFVHERPPNLLLSVVQDEIKLLLGTKELR